MREEIRRQHPLFVKYTRAWLNEVTGYTKEYLCRIATGNTPLNSSFINQVCFKLNQPQEELFLPQPSDEQKILFTTNQCLQPRGCAASKFGQWLEERCQREHLSIREAATKAGLSHACIYDIIRGTRPSPETIKKLAHGFGGDGTTLEDHLLLLAGYRTQRPKEPSGALAELIDKVGQFDERTLRMMIQFADFLTEIEKKT